MEESYEANREGQREAPSYFLSSVLWGFLEKSSRFDFPCSINGRTLQTPGLKDREVFEVGICTYLGVMLPAPPNQSPSTLPEISAVSSSSHIHSPYLDPRNGPWYIVGCWGLDTARAPHIGVSGKGVSRERNKSSTEMRVKKRKQNFTFIKNFFRARSAY